MPIFHVHSPNKIIVASPKKLQNVEWILDAFRSEEAKIDLCEPSSMADITPPLLKGHIPRRTAFWLQIDDSGENAKVQYYMGKGTPSILGYDANYNLAAAYVQHPATTYEIGPDRAREFCVSGERGRGLSQQFLIGAVVLHRENEDVAALLQPQQETPPTQLG